VSLSRRFRSVHCITVESPRRFLHENFLSGPVPPLPSTIYHCILQYAHSDTNCLDCSTARGNCSAHCGNTGACQTTTSRPIATTTPSRAVVATSTPKPMTLTSSTSTSTIRITEFTPKPVATMYTTIAFDTDTSVGLSDTDSTTSTTTTSASETSSSSSLSSISTLLESAVTVGSPNTIDYAMIGGIVGGSVGFLLIVGLTVCLIVQSRRLQKAKSHSAQQQQSEQSSFNMQSARESARESYDQYGQFSAIQPPKIGVYNSFGSSNYDDPAVLNNSSNGNHYSPLTPSDYDSGALHL
jgi:hypothetical protein